MFKAEIILQRFIHIRFIHSFPLAFLFLQVLAFEY